MICSVLIPSRGNPKGLRSAIKSVFDTASSDQVEVLVRCDSDDLVTLSHLVSYNQELKFRTVVGPRMDGYSSMGAYLTELASIAHGDWITMLDDDCTFEGMHWDTKLGLLPLEGVMPQCEFYTLGHSKYGSNSCGVVGWFAPNKYWEKFGYKKMEQPCDIWTYNVLLINNGWRKELLRGITYNHQRAEGRA